MDLLMIYLTHWLQGDLNKILDKQFSRWFRHWQPRHHWWNCPQVDVTGPHCLLVNIGLGNGLVQSGNKPLPEPILTKTIWRHNATMSYLTFSEDSFTLRLYHMLGHGHVIAHVVFYGMLLLILIITLPKLPLKLYYRSEITSHHFI